MPGSRIQRAEFTATLSGIMYRLNGQRIVVPEPEAVAAMIYLATDTWEEKRLAEWIRSHLVALD